LPALLIFIFITAGKTVFVTINYFI